MSKKSLAKSASDDLEDFLDLSPPAPWMSPVTGEVLLDALHETIRTYVIADDCYVTAMVLWITHTYSFRQFHYSPLLLINAPERACGKSVALELIARLAHRSFETANITVAALFRIIHLYGPTVLIDEADTFLESNPEMAGILNKGYEHRGVVVRVETIGDRLQPVPYRVFGPKAIAGIAMERRLADATLSRCVRVQMRRKVQGETVQRLRSADRGMFATLRSQIHRFVADQQQSLREGHTDMPSELSDREQDNWEPLFAVARCAGPRWLAKAREAALSIKGSTEEPQSMSNNLLADIREVLASYRDRYIPSAKLLELLFKDSEMGWDSYNRGFPLTARQLAKNLSSYGIRSKTVRMRDASTPKGYEVREFEEVFKRYLGVPSASVDARKEGTVPAAPAAPAVAVAQASSTPIARSAPVPYEFPDVDF